MHPYFLYDLYKQNLGRWERDAELRRIFMEAGRGPELEKKQRRAPLVSAFLSRPRARRVLAAKAHPCP